MTKKTDSDDAREERARRLRQTIKDVQEGVPVKKTPESPRDFINRRMAELDKGEKKPV